jgi:hypothetical protein
MRLKDLSCVGFHFSQNGFGDIVSNFTFRWSHIPGANPTTFEIKATSPARAF